MTDEDARSELSHPGADALTAKILELCIERGPAKSICPSEVARALEAEEDAWRRLMKPVRRAAIRLAEDGRIEILKKGKRIEPDNVRGVVRLRISPDTPS